MRELCTELCPCHPCAGPSLRLSLLCTGSSPCTVPKTSPPPANVQTYSNGTSLYRRPYPSTCSLVANTVGKWAVGIQTKCHLVTINTLNPLTLTILFIEPKDFLGAVSSFTSYDIFDGLQESYRSNA